MSNYLGLEIKKYQDEAIEKLKTEVNDLLNLDGDKLAILEAPTGSGKTIMLGEFLRRFVNPIDREDGKTFSFIWISVRDLHNQSKRSLKKNFPDDFIYSDFDDLTGNKIRRNEILFLNWESINKEKNVYVRENEKNKNLSTVIANTKSTGRHIVLIIDESHHTALSERSTKIKNDIGAKITIEVSATPIFRDPDATVKVHFEKVVAEGMIKKEIAINPEFKKFKISGKSSREMVVDAAITKQEELRKAYQAEGSNINPLVLIQLPNLQSGINDLDKDVLTEVQRILKARHDITEENGRLAIWLAENKTPNLINIEKSSNEVDVLIFKQAIALGWDCPRAAILVIFRETKDKKFLIQTVGRIMRMPEFCHYDNHPGLNRGYVFTNLGEIEVVGEIARDYLTIQEAKRKSLYKNIDIPSVHFKRQREHTRLSGEFVKIFMELAKKNNLKSKIDIEARKVSKEIVVDGKIVNIDKAKEVEYSTMMYSSPEMEIQAYYDLFCKANTTGFAPVDSMARIKSALNKFFTTEFNFENDDIEFYKVVLSKENVEKVKEALARAKEEYKKKTLATQQEREMETLIWNVPEILSYNSRYKKKDYGRSIMQPYYTPLQESPQASLFAPGLEEDSNVEVDFIHYLEKSKKVRWWFKNGTKEKNYFAVPYKNENGELSAFYVDFIVQLSNGRIGLFDTKGGRTAETAGPRAEGLAKYIKEQVKKGKKMMGGIAVSSYGQWRLNDKDKYNYNANNLGKDWEYLDLN